MFSPQHSIAPCGRNQRTYPNFCGFYPYGLSFAPSHPQYTLVLNSKPSNSIIYKSRGFVRDLAAIPMESDSYLLSFDHLVGHLPIIWVDLVPLLCETLHSYSTIMTPPWFHKQHLHFALAVPSGQPYWLTHMDHIHLELCLPEFLSMAL
jgi:hypothetical protein